MYADKSLDFEVAGYKVRVQVQVYGVAEDVAGRIAAAVHREACGIAPRVRVTQGDAIIVPRGEQVERHVTALQQIASLESNADSVVGLVDASHTKALRAASRIAREALAREKLDEALTRHGLDKREGL